MSESPSNQRLLPNLGIKSEYTLILDCRGKTSYWLSSKRTWVKLGHVVHVLCITFPLADGDVKIEVREADYLKPKQHLSLFR